MNEKEKKEKIHPTHKVCKGICGLDKLIDEFDFVKHENRYSAKCKICFRANANQRNRIEKENKLKIIATNPDPIFKICEKCNELKNIYTDFFTTNTCIDCRKKYMEEYNFINKEELALKKKEFRDTHKSECMERKREYYYSHQEEISKYGKNYYDINKDKILDKNKAYRDINKEKIKEQSKGYQKKYSREKRKNDAKYKIRQDFSRSINKSLKNNGGSKCGKKVKDLDYTFKEYLENLEKQFEWWMHWGNRGLYDPKTWVDDDITTMKWQIDHIKPVSDFNFTTMDDEEFKQCWALSNLRPLSAKQNLFDGVNRTRHIKKVA